MSALAPATIFQTVPLALVFVLLTGVLALLLWSTVTQRDRWPFSHYPMFGVATEANSVRFFILRVQFENGTVGNLGGAANALSDSFHREFEGVWDAAPISLETADALVLRYWHEACRLDRQLVSARQVEVVMRVGRLIRADDVVVGEKAVHVVKTGQGGIDR